LSIYQRIFKRTATATAAATTAAVGVTAPPKVGGIARRVMLIRGHRLPAAVAVIVVATGTGAAGCMDTEKVHGVAFDLD
jgi:hypothetical protein